MVGSAFKTMYLVSKSDIDNNVKKNFKLSLQNKDICDGGMSVSVKPIKRRIRNKPEIENSVQSLNDGNDDDGEDENEADSKSKFKQQYSKPTKQIPPNYGFSRRDSNMEQRRSVNYDKSKLDFSTYSEEFGDDDNGQDKRHYDQKKYNKINPNNKFKPSELKAKYRKKRGWNEIKQLKRQRSEINSDNENNEEERHNTAQMEKRQLVNYDEPKQDSSTYSDMEESSDDGRQDEKPDDIDDKSYITYDRERNSDDNKDNKIDEAEENSMDESMNRSEGDIDQLRQGVNYRKKRKGNKMKRLKKRKMIAYAKQLSKIHRGKDRIVDGKSSFPINPSENDLGKGDIQSNANKKHKFDNDVNNQFNLEDINLKRRKILDDINKLKDDQWLRRIKSRLNDKRVQFKRKQDTVGYRINPDDISKSLIKPSDFTYLNKDESADFLDKWRPLKELRSKPFKNKRFKPYR